jgi:hypothetical protein
VIVAGGMETMASELDDASELARVVLRENAARLYGMP